MNEFEQHLRQQPLRKVPSEWRDDILSAASESGQHIARRSSESAFGSRFTWRELLWPCPQAWAGLAAAWILIVMANSTAGDSNLARHKPVPPAPEVLLALREQRRLMAELIGPVTSLETPRAFVPRPRSERPPEYITV